jgi:hypothetical protein
MVCGRVTSANVTWGRAVRRPQRRRDEQQARHPHYAEERQ